MVIIYYCRCIDMCMRFMRLATFLRKLSDYESVKPSFYLYTARIRLFIIPLYDCSHNILYIVIVILLSHYFDRIK